MTAIDIWARTLGQFSTWTIYSMDQLAECHSRQGHYQEALSIKTEILNHRKLTQGYEHPATLSDMEWIVRLHCEYENYEDAATVLRQVVEGKKVTQGPRHRDTLYTMRILRLLYLHQGIRGEELLAKDVKGLYISRPEEEQTPKRELVAFCQTDHVPKMISGQAPLHSWLHFIKDEPPQEAFQSPAWTRPRDSERGEGNKLCTLDNNHEDSGDSLDDRWSSDDGYYPAFSEESAAEEPSDYPKRARVAKPVQILAEEEEAGLRSEPREKKVVGEASSTVSFSDYSPKSEKAGGYVSISLYHTERSTKFSTSTPQSKPTGSMLSTSSSRRAHMFSTRIRPILRTWMPPLSIRTTSQIQKTRTPRSIRWACW